MIRSSYDIAVTVCAYCYYVFPVTIYEFQYVEIDYSTEHKWIEKLTATTPQPFYNVLLFLITLCVVWNLVRRLVTRRLTRPQPTGMYNVLKYSKTW